MQRTVVAHARERCTAMKKKLYIYILDTISIVSLTQKEISFRAISFLPAKNYIFPLESAIKEKTLVIISSKKFARHISTRNILAMCRPVSRYK